MDNDKMDILKERQELAVVRIREISRENLFGQELDDYFQNTAQLLLRAMEKKREPERYGSSYANPDFSAEKLGEGYGRLLSFLYYELMGVEAFAGENKFLDVVIRMELFLEIHAAFSCEWQENARWPKEEAIRQILYWFAFDYADVAAEQYVEELVLKKGRIYRDSFSILYDQQLNGQNRMDSIQRDHLCDISFFLDKGYVSRKIEVLKTAFEKYREPLNNSRELYKKAAVSADADWFTVLPQHPGRGKGLNEQKQRLWTDYRRQVAQLYQEYLG